MKDMRFWFGIALSAFWMLVMGAFIFWGKHPVEINGWGDFFAGFFAPIAFLWLVLGYMQQGEELRAQARELENSVRQQTALVEISRAQLEQETEALRAERRAATLAAQPRFVLKTEGATAVDDKGRMTVRYILINRGAPVSSVHMAMGPDIHRWVAGLDTEFMDRGQTQEVQFDVVVEEEVVVKIYFLDGRGNWGEVSGIVQPNSLWHIPEVVLDHVPEADMATN